MDDQILFLHRIEGTPRSDGVAFVIAFLVQIVAENTHREGIVIAFGSGTDAQAPIKLERIGEGRPFQGRDETRGGLLIKRIRGLELPELQCPITDRLPLEIPVFQIDFAA